MDIQSLLIFLAIGAVAGWLAGLLMRGGGFGLLGNIVVGIIGAVVGGFLFGLVGLSVGGCCRRHKTAAICRGVGRRVGTAAGSGHSAYPMNAVIAVV